MITQKISLDLQLSQRRPVLYAKQGDALQRQVEISFFSGGSTWNVPAALSVYQVVFCKPDGLGGAYDTMPAEEYDATRAYAEGDFCWRLEDGTRKYYHCTTAIGSGGEAWNAAHWAAGGETAVSVSNNAATVKIAPEVLTCAGPVAMELQMMSDAGDQITSWTWIYQVAQSVESAIQSQDYWNVQSLRQMQAAILEMKAMLEGLREDVDGLLFDMPFKAAKESIANGYNASETYAVGDYCFHLDVLWRCIVPITTAEEWNSDHWEAVVLGSDVAEAKHAIGDLDDLETTAKDNLVDAINEAAQTGGGGGGTGLTGTQISAIIGMFQVAAYSEDPGTAYAALLAAFPIYQDGSALVIRGGVTAAQDGAALTLS